MNSLSQKEINGQLFYLSKEAVKTIVLESKCGLISSIKSFKRLPSTTDVTTNSNFSPLLCVYRKASPNFIHSKNSNGFDEDTFKKDINVSTNALMTLSLLELLDYYRNFENIENNIYGLYHIYKKLTKDQLEFYSINLRNTEGVFIDKKNLLDNNYKNFNLVDRDKKFKFSDQAFMMLAYYLYSLKNPDDELATAYNNFSLEILQMFIDYKEKIYECSLDEICKILLALNILYSYNEITELKMLIIDLSDYAMSKFEDKDYYVDSLDTAALCSITLSLAYKHTNILTFLDKSTEIINKLSTLYDVDKETFYKLSSKKEIKYSCFDITFYFLAFVIYSDITDSKAEYKNLISSIYKKFFINSGLIPSWPEAPTLDDYERYRGLTLSSEDMLDESYFRMPNLATPTSSGIAPIFNKSVTYNKRKDTFSSNKTIFDSYKNFLNFYIFIHFFKDDYMSETRTLSNNISNETNNKESINDNDSSVNTEDMNKNSDINISNTETNDTVD
jgi:hypothetical protein